jgi:hypothetical protein
VEHAAAAGCKCEDDGSVKDMVEELKVWLDVLRTGIEMAIWQQAEVAGVGGGHPTVGKGCATVTWSAGVVSGGSSSGGRPCSERWSNSIKTDFGG